MTFYTVAKLNVLCGPTDQKIALSRGWSYSNLLLSTIGFAVGIYLLDQEESILFSTPYPFTTYILAVILTIIFLHYDTICCSSCCCDCCIGEEQMVIHDPSNPEANLVWKNKQVSM